MSKRTAANGYDDYRERQAEISRERSASGREVGPIPPVVKPRRKARCRRSLKLFLETYLKGRFPLKWSPAHLTAIEKLERCVLAGGQFAYAMPRGSGKTTLAECGALFSVLYGHRRFVALIGATEDAAKEMLVSLKVELETNDLLAEDFPEVCHPIRMLEGIANRANGQTVDKERTRIVWTDTRAVLPTVAGSPASGARIRVAGITGRVRGMKATTADGASIRPDLAIVDDPQTDESADSPVGIEKRERVLNGAVLGLAGPGTKIAAFVPCTVIHPCDLADRILDRGRYPVWQGERSRMVISWPTNRELWDRYAELRNASLREGGIGEPATTFYRAHRAAMDAGAEVSWPDRKEPDDLSAIQHAMNLRIDRGDRAFMAEYQNDPMPEDQGGAAALAPADVVRKASNLPQRSVPRTCTRLTAFIDVGAHLLWWMVCAWDERFSGAVIDYGPYPEQGRSYFAATDPRPGLQDLPTTRGTGQDAAIYAGLTAVAARILGATWRHEETGAELRVERCLVDANWGPGTDLVYEWVRRSPHAGLIYPSHGRFIGASSNPMVNWAVKPGERPGWNWRLSAPASGRGRHVTFDANHWKSFAADRIRTPDGAAGCLRLFAAGSDGHRLLAEHLTAEYPVPVARPGGRTVEEWKDRPNRDNHLWDCLVGCCVAASVLGLQWSAGVAAGETHSVPTQPKPIKLSEIQRQKMQGRRNWQCR